MDENEIFIAYREKLIQDFHEWCEDDKYTRQDLKTLFKRAERLRWRISDTYAGIKRQRTPMRLRLDEGDLHNAMIQFLTKKLKVKGLTSTMRQKRRGE